jgi:hypothetical protein
VVVEDVINGIKTGRELIEKLGNKFYKEICNDNPYFK